MCRGSPLPEGDRLQAVRIGEPDAALQLGVLREQGHAVGRPGRRREDTATQVGEALSPCVANGTTEDPLSQYENDFLWRLSWWLSASRCRLSYRSLMSSNEVAA